MRDLAWRRSHSPARGRGVSVLQRFGPGLVPADLLGRFAPEPLGVGHRRCEVGLVLAATAGRRQRSAAPTPESAPRAGGHVSPAGRAGPPRRRGPRQGPPESPGAGDFATLQPRRLHRRRPGPPGPGVHSADDSWGAPDFPKPAGSVREAGAAPERRAGR